MPDIHQHIVDLRAAGRSAVLVTVVAKSGHVPLPPPGKILVDADGPVAGTVGGGALEAMAIDEARRVLTGGESLLKEYLLDEERPGVTAEATGMLCGGKATLFFEVLGARPRAYLLGAGHVGRAVARLLQLLDYAPVLVDCRPEMEPDLLAGPDYATLPELPGLDEASVVIATHAHSGDRRVLEHLLDAGVRPPYVGMVASTRKWRAIAEELARTREDADDLGWVRAPAGLRLGGRTPAEIALAIVAQIQATRTGEGDHDHMAGGGRP